MHHPLKFVNRPLMHTLLGLIGTVVVVLVGTISPNYTWEGKLRRKINA